MSPTRHQPTPAHLPRPRRPLRRVAVIDVDNIALGGRGVLVAHRALESLDAVAAAVAGSELVFAVASRSVAVPLDLWFRYPQWAFRPADVGPDAADRQLLDFATCVLRQRPGAQITVASGDHIFAALAGVAELRVVVPLGHRGVSARLRPWLQRVPPAAPPAVAA